MSRLREGALLLHSLAEPDRAWLLSQLPPAARERLASLQAELSQLGLQLPAAPARSALPAAPRAVPASLLDALAGEPWWLLRAVLALPDWPWRLQLLARLDPAQRARVADAAATALAPRLAQALGAALDELERCAVPASAAGWRHRIGAVLPWLK